MAVFETWLKTDLKKPVKVQQIGGVVFSQDNKANKVGVIVSEGGRPVELSGTVYGYVIIPTGETVEVEGAIEDTNRAYFLMPQECYVEGHISVVIKLTSGDVITTIGACTAYVYKSKTSAEVVPSGTPIPDLSVLMEAIDDAMDQVAEVVESIPEDYTNLSNDVTNLKSAIGLNYLSFTVVSGKYIDNSGADKSNGNFSRSAPIQVLAQSTVVITAAGYNQGVAMIATCDENGNSIKAVTVSVDSTKRTYTYYTAVDTYVIVSYLTSQGCELSLLDSKSNDVLSRRMAPVETAVLNSYVPSYTAVSGKFINSAGNEVSSGNFTHSSVIPVSAKAYVIFRATGYLQSVAMIATCDQAGTTFIPVAVSLDSSEHTYTYFAKQDCYIIISYKTNAGHEIYIYGATANVSLLANINSIESALPLVGKNILSAFTNITCIGDSLTFGAVFTAQNTYRQAYKPYPAILGVKTGATIANLGETGATGSSWWSRHSTQIEEKTNQLTIVYLGTNSGLTDTIDVDMVGDDFTQWADTNTGDYGKIIAKSISVGSKVLLVKIYTSSGDKETTNSVIEKMAERFNIPVIENDFLSDRKYHYYPDASGFNSTHYNDFGYAVFTDQLIYNISNMPTDIMKLIIPN